MLVVDGILLTLYKSLRVKNWTWYDLIRFRYKVNLLSAKGGIQPQWGEMLATLNERGVFDRTQFIDSRFLCFLNKSDRKFIGKILLRGPILPTYMHTIGQIVIRSSHDGKLYLMMSNGGEIGSNGRFGVRGLPKYKEVTLIDYNLGHVTFDVLPIDVSCLIRPVEIVDLIVR
jgi:hypothetical protein